MILNTIAHKHEGKSIKMHFLQHFIHEKIQQIELLIYDSHLDTKGLIELVECANPEADGGPQLVVRDSFPHGERTPAVKFQPFLLA